MCGFYAAMIWIKFCNIMKHLRISQDKSKRLIFKRDELKKNVICLLNYRFYNCLFFDWKRIESGIYSRVELKNYCILSGRPRGVFKDFKLSRILLRKMGAKGFLFGLKKKSW